MSKLAAVFFVISDSLLWPVMIGLLLGLAASLWRLGSVLREGVERAKGRKKRADFVKALEQNDLQQAETLAGAEQNNALFDAFRVFFEVKADLSLLEKKLADLQNARVERSTLTRVLMKIGPALGLMGTLIPLGPALVGLATGNLDVLAQNLGIAFATTVVGLTTSVLAFFSSILEKRWRAQDGVLAAFTVERLINAAGTEGERG